MVVEAALEKGNVRNIHKWRVRNKGNAYCHQRVNLLLGIQQMPLTTAVKSPKYMFAFLCGQLLLESRFENTCCFIFLRGRGKGRGRITTQNWGDDGDILDISPACRVKVI